MMPSPSFPTLQFLGAAGTVTGSKHLLGDPEGVPSADVPLIESTHGDSDHVGDPVESLAAVVRESAAEERVLLIPAFAVARTRTLIWVLRELEESGRMPRIPIVIDSPMANRVSEVSLADQGKD